MDTLLESIVIWEQGKFHSSKMVFWSYLRNNTTNGQMTFPLGQMAAISNVFSALCSNTSEQKKNALFVTESVNITCRNCNHSRDTVNTYSTFFIHNTNIKMTNVVNSAFDPIRVAEKLLIQQDILCLQRSVCLRSNEDGSLRGGKLKLQTSSVVNEPFLIAIELDKGKTRPV